jgi:hypothetical protein
LYVRVEGHKKSHFRTKKTQDLSNHAREGRAGKMIQNQCGIVPPTYLC